MDSDTPRPTDGSIDFSRYSLTQLEELRFAINAEASPLNHANLLAAIDALRAQEAARPPDSAVSGRFTSRDGFLGWLQAKRKRSPVYGAGAIEVTPSDVLLRGWQRTWLGMPVQTELTVRLETVRNVAVEDQRLYF